jgi:hypothetical protein
MEFNSQISIYSEIKQWFLGDIRTINIILSIFMQTVKRIIRENVERDKNKNGFC